MSQYLILLYEDEASYATADEATMNEVLQAHNMFAENNGKALQGGNALQDTSTATTLRSDGAGGFTVTDGPFVETKEALGGYYLIEAADLDEAIAIAKQVPAKFGAVEVRPIMVFS
ncbi:MAG: YciI family protein [Pseudonocardiales bacterium]